MKKSLILAAMVALALATVAQAQSGGGEVKLTMDEVAFQPINGLTVKGVTFHDTTGATYNTGNGGQLMWTSDPVIEGGTDDVITIDFPYAVQEFQFGVAMSTGATVPNAVWVDIYGQGGVFLGTYSASVQSYGSFSNGLFVSPSNIGTMIRAVVRFNNTPPTRFGLDNLTFSLYNDLFGALLGW